MQTEKFVESVVIMKPRLTPPMTLIGSCDVDAKVGRMNSRALLERRDMMMDTDSGRTPCCQKVLNHRREGMTCSVKTVIWMKTGWTWL